MLLSCAGTNVPSLFLPTAAKHLTSPEQVTVKKPELECRNVERVEQKRRASGAGTLTRTRNEGNNAQETANRIDGCVRFWPNSFHLLSTYSFPGSTALTRIARAVTFKICHSKIIVLRSNALNCLCCHNEEFTIDRKQQQQ